MRKRKGTHAKPSVSDRISQLADHLQQADRSQKDRCQTLKVGRCFIFHLAGCMPKSAHATLFYTSQEAYDNLVEVEDTNEGARDAAARLLAQLLGLLKTRDKVHVSLIGVVELFDVHSTLYYACQSQHLSIKHYATRCHRRSRCMWHSAPRGVLRCRVVRTNSQ